MGLLGEPPSPPPLCRAGQGDHTTALNILAAVLAALRVRDQTGEAQYVEVTLQGTGMYTLATDFQAALVAHEQPRRHDRTRPANPIWNSYQCGRRRVGAARDAAARSRYWPRFCAAIGKPEWAADPRYDSLAKRRDETRRADAGDRRRLRGHDLAALGGAARRARPHLGAGRDAPRRDRRPAGARDGLDHHHRPSDARPLRDRRHAVPDRRRRHRRARRRPRRARTPSRCWPSSASRTTRSRASRPTA